jgi:hypothetical protein
MAIETSTLSATSLTGSLYGTASVALETPLAQQAVSSSYATYALGTVIVNGTEVTEYSDLMQFKPDGLPITKYNNPNLKWLPFETFNDNSTTLLELDLPELTYAGYNSLKNIAFNITYINVPKLETIFEIVFAGIGMNGVINISTNIQNSQYWPSSEGNLLANGWTINYVNA